MTPTPYLPKGGSLISFKGLQARRIRLIRHISPHWPYP